MRFTRSSQGARQTRPIGRYRIVYADGATRWAIQSHFPSCEPSASPFEIRRDQALEFDVVAPAVEIDRIELCFATFARVNRGTIWCELLDEHEEVLACRAVDVAALADNGFATVIEGTGLVLTIGRKYLLRVSTTDGRRGNCVAVWSYAVPAGEQELRRSFVDMPSKRLFVENQSVTPRLGATVLCPPDRDLGETIARLRRCFPDIQLTVLSPGAAMLEFRRLRQSDFVIFANCHSADGYGGVSYDALCFELHRHGVVTLFFETSSPPSDPETLDVAIPEMAGALRARAQHRARCHFSLTEGFERRLTMATSGERWPLGEEGVVTAALCKQMSAVIRDRRLPHLAIVTVLYRKVEIIETFLDHVVRQSYPGPITVVMVDDGSPERDAASAEAYSRIAAANGVENRSFKIIRNAVNLGNCGSRHAGIAAVDADLYVVMDCDCLINRDFAAAHVFEHWFDDVDVVIGPLNIETGDRDGATLVREIEAEPSRLASEAEPQDPVQPDGFVNCITRNFSFKRRVLERGDLFDLDFSYSMKPDSGFGWEDVEMGYRLYAAGSVIRFTSLAFAVHCSHPSSMPESQKAAASLRNFARLFEKHPDMALAARRWSTETYGRIVDWADNSGAAVTPGRIFLDSLFKEQRARLEPLLKGYRRGHRPLRILSYRWHVPHQYELYKLPHHFTLATQLGNGMVDHWQFDQRPLRPNVTLQSIEAVDPSAYDVAILHFDENVLAPHLTNGVIPSVWGKPFRHFLQQFPHLPKVAICHGTPQFEGQYGLDPERKSAFSVHEDEKATLVAELAQAGVKVVCNSYQAHREWGFADSRVIWHGIDPQEFPKGSLSRDILALDLDRHRPHYRGAWEHERVAELLDPRLAIETARHFGAPIEKRDGNGFAIRQFRAYVDRIRQFTAYLNTTLRSPMPRSRTEAMMTGVIPVCLRNHDVDMFIENGVDGFYADSPEELAEFLNELFADRAMASAMSAAARRKAMDVFNHDNYLLAWTELLNDAVG